ncbi:MAG: DUF695 domain-containing protein [Agriterribacter sp.]
MKKSLLFLCCFFIAWSADAQQQYTGNWDTYIMDVDNRPATVMVDLGFGGSEVAKERPNVIIVSVRLIAVLQNGMPSEKESKVLDEVEDRLVDTLNDGLQALYTGRFTKNGRRDFYFYSNDTSDYRLLVSEALRKYPAFKWMAVARPDKEKSNYFNVLYPTSKEMERIQNRRVVDDMKEKGDVLTAPRRVDHFIYFKTEADRKKYASIVQDSGFVIENAGKELGAVNRPYSLQISRADRIDYASIDKVTLYLWELALKHFAKYDGWETFVVKEGGQ